MIFAQETIDLMELLGQALGIALTVLILLTALARLAAGFIHMRL